MDKVKRLSKFNEIKEDEPMWMIESYTDLGESNPTKIVHESDVEEDNKQ